jgi:hypothetical protein
MSFTPRIRALAAVAAAVSCAAAGAALVPDAPVRAQQTGRTYTITYGEMRQSMLDVAPKGMGRGRVSLGDHVFVSGAVWRDGAVSGTLQAVFTVGNARPIRIDRASGLISGVYRLADGDIYLQASATFDDTDTDHGAVVGGTGAYAGARGTIDSSAARDVVHLLP